MPRKPKPTKECPVRLMSDEEFNAMTIKENKSSFLNSLTSASSTSKGFSAKRIRERNEKKSEQNKSLSTFSLDNPAMDIPERVDYIDDERWEELLQKFDEISPIDDITDEERSYYRRKTDGDKFDELFKKERSMLSDVLTDIQKRSKLINARINSMSGKGSYGVSKNFVELVDAGTGMDKAKLDVIKAMADLKKTATDLRMKEMKNNPVTNDESNDTIADKFYKSIIGGGSQKFIQSSIQQYRTNDANHSLPGTFNITQPLSNTTISSNYSNNNADKYGYIRNENKHVDICLYRFNDNHLEFVALDENGNEVPDYELPSDMLLDTIDIKPMAKYGYDKFQRKYRIIDVNDTVDLRNIDDESYDSENTDDKYDYDE